MLFYQWGGAMKKIINYVIYLFLIISFGRAEKIHGDINKHFMVIIPSWNNSPWCERNLEALRTQTYDNWHAIYINDNSDDDTGQKVEQFIKNHHLEGKITLINNKTRKGAMYNIYQAIHTFCNDTDVVVNYDGDDWFSSPNVFTILNQEYANENVWMTYGSFQIYPCGTRGVDPTPTPKEIIESNAYRKDEWRASHVRTFYAWLFKRIKTEDLQMDGTFFSVTCDQAIMLPLLEMSGGRFKYIEDILYIYNRDNPYNDGKIIDILLPAETANIIRLRNPYQPLEDIIC